MKLAITGLVVALFLMQAVCGASITSSHSKAGADAGAEVQVTTPSLSTLPASHEKSGSSESLVIGHNSDKKAEPQAQEGTLEKRLAFAVVKNIFGPSKTSNNQRVDDAVQSLCSPQRRKLCLCGSESRLTCKLNRLSELSSLWSRVPAHRVVEEPTLQDKVLEALRKSTATVADWMPPAGIAKGLRL